MRWLTRGLALALLVLLLGALGLVGASQLSLDWERQHSARTGALPLLSRDAPDGLVRIDANGMTFRARVAGMGNAGAGVILLHGFPATSIMWEPVIAAATAAGHRVLALDQRGYSPGARPEGVSAYTVPKLVEDVIAVADAAGFDRFHLIGHDWGCVVGWGVAIQHPERLRSWSGLSIPHPGTLLADLQRELPSYIKVFTAPMVPETMLTLRGMPYGEAIPEHHVDEYRAVFLEPGALTAALNWYRAITTSLDDGEQVAGRVEVTTLFIWGTGESWVTPAALERQRTLMTGAYEELELEAGHWVLEEQTAAVVDALMAHLQRADLR